MAGRSGINTVYYSRAFISKLWIDRAKFSDYERRGFYQFLYITACGHLESVIADYLKGVLRIPLFNSKPKNGSEYPIRSVIREGNTQPVSMEFEMRAIEGLIKKTVEDIEKSPFSKLESFHQTIVGKTLRNVVGNELHDALKGLVSVRNLFAHGRELYIDITDSLEADLSFEQHPIETAIKSLKQANLFTVNDDVLDANDIKSIIYRDDVVSHFWNASAKIAKIYMRRVENEDLFMFGFNYAIEELTLHEKTTAV